MSVTLLQELDIRDSYGNIMCKALCPVCNKEFVCRKSQLSSRKSCGCFKGNRSVNTYKEIGEVTEIYDSKGNKTLVDSEDVPLLKGHYWYADSRGYWLSHFPQGRVYLHKYVMKADSKGQVDIFIAFAVIIESLNYGSVPNLRIVEIEKFQRTQQAL